MSKNKVKEKFNTMLNEEAENTLQATGGGKTYQDKQGRSAKMGWFFARNP